MRASAFLALGAAVLAAAPLAASANTITVEFGIPIESGSLGRGFPSFSFSGFNPSLGTLTDATLSLSGSLSTTSTSPTLTLTLSGLINASQTLTNLSSGQIEFDLEGSTSVVGSGSQKETFTPSGGGRDSRVFRTFLEGAVTYDYTPPPSSILGPPPPGNITIPLTTPEPSTWAMMLLGFAGLGYAGLRRKAAVRMPSA